MTTKWKLFEVPALIKLAALPLLSIVCLPRAAIAAPVSSSLAPQFSFPVEMEQRVYDYIDLEIPIARIDDANSPESVLGIEGKGTFVRYEFPENRSLHELVKLVKVQLANGRLKVLFECEKKTGEKVQNPCGDESRYLVDRNRVYRGPGSYSCDGFYPFYLASAVLERSDNKRSYLYLCALENRMSVSIIEEKDFDFDRVKVDTANYQPDAASLNGLSAQTRPDIEGASDHPLITRYQGSAIREQRVSNYMPAYLPVKKITNYKNRDSDEFVGIAGKVTDTSYLSQRGTSQFQVTENYLQALKTGGFVILYQCRGKRECGSEIYALFNTGGYLEDSDLATRRCSSSSADYITAVKQVYPGQSAYLFLCFASSLEDVNISQVVVEEKPLQQGLVTISAGQIEQSVKSKGKVAIYGIQFATDSVEILETSIPSLKEIAKYLTKYPGLKFYVVGHTDSQGSESHNQLLSQQRGESVVKALTSEHGIPSDRLLARGVGPLVPVSTNRADGGRQLNRRVELVEM